MKATITTITKMFNEFNVVFFNDELKGIEFMISNRMSSALGKASVKSNYWNTERTITISGCYDFTELQLANTLVHEMIHIWQYNHYRDMGHGYTFKKKASEIMSYDNTFTIERLYNIDKEGELVSTKEVKDSYVMWFKHNDGKTMGLKINKDKGQDIVVKKRMNKLGYEFLNEGWVNVDFWSSKHSMLKSSGRMSWYYFDENNRKNYGFAE